jgi:hypothetical protein
VLGMNDTAVVSALSPIATTIAVALIFWGWRSFRNTLNEAKQVAEDVASETRMAANKTNGKIDELALAVRSHQTSDDTAFHALDTRVVAAETAIGLLTQLLSASLAGAPPPSKKEFL